MNYMAYDCFERVDAKYEGTEPRVSCGKLEVTTTKALWSPS